MHNTQHWPKIQSAVTQTSNTQAVITNPPCRNLVRSTLNQENSSVPKQDAWHILGATMDCTATLEPPQRSVACCCSCSRASTQAGEHTSAPRTAATTSSISSWYPKQRCTSTTSSHTTLDTLHADAGQRQLGVLGLAKDAECCAGNV